MAAKLCPYLNFDGNTADAMRFYQSILGGRLNMQTFADAFPGFCQPSRSWRRAKRCPKRCPKP